MRLLWFLQDYLLPEGQKVWESLHRQGVSLARQPVAPPNLHPPRDELKHNIRVLPVPRNVLLQFRFPQDELFPKDAEIFSPTSD